MNINPKLADALRAFDILITQRAEYLGGLSDEMQCVADKARVALAAYDAEEAEQAKLRDDHELTIEAARSNYASDDIQIDDLPARSVVKGGVWVAGWLFIPIESEEVQP